MLRSGKRFIYGLFTLMVISAMPYPVAADDDHHEGYLRPINNPAYKEVCGVCHFLYQPELLPAASWMNILANPKDHFGEIVEIDDNSKREITAYLQSNSAEKSSVDQAVKIMQSLGNQVPARVTDIPYIQEKHMGIPSDFFSSKAVGSRSNCSACHTTAENGIYDDDDVKIPR